MTPEQLEEYTFGADGLVAKPYTLVPDSTEPEAAAHAMWKNSTVLRRCAAQESLFNDFVRGCGGECEGFCTDRSPQCDVVKRVVTRELTKPDAVVWEVWKEGSDVDLVGILRLDRVQLAGDARAHYFFFDGRLVGKTPLLKAWSEWVFSDHPVIGWTALSRVTVEVPAHAFALARHAQKRLGFGGPYNYRSNGHRLKVEGARRLAQRWRGEWEDMVVMGLINPKRPKREQDDAI